MVNLFPLFIVSETLMMMLSEDLVHHLVASGAHMNTVAPTLGAVHRRGRT